jgi:hypothetical protein
VRINYPPFIFCIDIRDFLQYFSCRDFRHRKTQISFGSNSKKKLELTAPPLFSLEEKTPRLMAFLLIYLPSMRKFLFDFTTSCSNGYLIFCHVETTPLSTRNLFFQSVDSKQIARSRAVELTSVIYDLPRIDNPVSANYSRSKTKQQILRMKLNLDFSSLRSDTRKKFMPIAQVLQRDLIPRLLISRGDFSPEYHVYTGATMKIIGAKIYLVQRDRNNKLRFIRILQKFKYNPRFLPAVRVSSRSGIMTFQSPLNRMKLNGALFGVKLFNQFRGI